MDGYGFLIAFAALVVAVLAYQRLGKLEVTVSRLRDEVARLKQAGAAHAGEAVTAPPAAEPVAEAAAATPTAEPAFTSAAWSGGRAAQDTPAAAPPASVRDVEQALAGRWFVWIGGVAIAIGGLLFVKYAYDNGLIPPALQVILGLLAGLALVGAGDWVRRRSPPAEGAAPNYVPAALSAAGLVVLFASIYAAYALYEILDPTAAFLGLAAVGLGALALSRWQGPFIAALGLLGSYVTPMLIPSAEPSAWGFFPYLLIVLAASVFTLRGRTWWWLGHAAIAGNAVWSLLWMIGPFELPDVWPVGLSAIAMGLLAMFGPRGRSALRETGEGIAPARAVGIAGQGATMLILALLAYRADHGTAALLLLAVNAGLVVALAWAGRSLSWLAPAAALTMLLVLAGWQQAAFHALTLDENGLWSWSNSFGPEAQRYLRWMLGCAACFSAIGCAGVLLHGEKRAWGALGGGAGFLFLWLAWARADFLLWPGSWAGLHIVLGVLLLLVAALWSRRAEGDDLGAGLLAAGAAALLVTGLDRLFDGVWLTLAIAALGLALAALTGLLKPRLMGPLTVAVATLATLRLFLSAELWFDDRSLPLGQHWVLYGYGLPAMLFIVASRLVRRTGHARASVALEGISLGLLISLLSLEMRALIAGGYIYEEPQFLEMAAHVLAWAGAAYGLMHRQRLYSSIVSLWGARILLALSAAAAVLLSLLTLNPVVTEVPVPGGMVFNALLLAYLAPALLTGLIARRLGVIGWEGLRPAAYGLALVLLFAYVTLQTKRVFQGAIMVAWSQSLAETYAYSAVWLAFALALFVAGIRLGRQAVRMAGLGVLALVVLKVFIGDMSNLEGLLRIASFVGLGFCLVGIGWLYQRFVRPERGLAFTAEEGYTPPR